MLITEKSGKIKLIELSAGNVSEVTHNLKILEDGQGGLLHILYKMMLFLLATQRITENLNLQLLLLEQI